MFRNFIIGASGSMLFLKDRVAHRDGDFPSSLGLGFKVFRKHGRIYRQQNKPSLVKA
jgi:hypothetical protein